MNILRQLSGKGDYLDGKIGCIELWKRVFFDYLNSSDSNYPVRREHNTYTDGGSLFSGKDNVVFFYTIDSYPNELMVDYRKLIRLEAKFGVKVSFISTMQPTKIDWNSPQIKSKLRTWKNIDDSMEESNSFDRRESLSSEDNNELRKESLEYLADAELRRQRNLFKYRTMMIISGKRGSDFNDAVRRVEDYCSKTGIVINKVTSELGSYLRYFSPFSLEMVEGIDKKVGNTTLTDEIIARVSSYDQGRVGKGELYWGNDIESGFPVFKQLKKNAVDAENILITAETGGGKSYFLKGLIEQLLASPRFTGTIMDIEGFEYLPIAAFVSNNDKVVVLNMAEGKGKYYDPVEIVVTGNKDLDEDMFSFSKSFTLSILKTLIGRDTLDKYPWATIIINDAVAKTYGSRGVTLDSSTWVNSKGLTLHDIYGTMKSLYREVKQGNISKDLTQQYKYNEGYKDTLDLVIAKLSVFFEKFSDGGTSSDIFQEKVTLGEIRDAKLVVCSFGMAGKSADMVDPIHMALSQLSAANISHLRSIFSQNRGLYNFKVWEEFQRWGAFPDSEKTITTALTGGRKLGDVNFIVTNKVQELLDSDRFGIFGNTTSFAIGSIDDSKTREEICERLSIPLLLKDLDKLVVKKGDNESFSSGMEFSSKYDKAFLIRLDKSVTTIVKMELPDSLSKSVLMRTGDLSLLK